jgi:hypothetical protein
LPFPFKVNRAADEGSVVNCWTVSSLVPGSEMYWPSTPPPEACRMKEVQVAVAAATVVVVVSLTVVSTVEELPIVEVMVFTTTEVAVVVMVTELMTVCVT